MANKTRVFISFDYDNDSKIKELLVGQAINPETPFEFVDWSIKEHLQGDWEQKANNRIRSVDVVCILCGTKTHTAKGVSAELRIAQREKIPYFCLKGYSDKNCTKPIGALETDKIYKWTWDNLKNLISGAR